MRNYMQYLIKEKEYKPRFYNPAKSKVITADHVARYFGVQFARMLCGYTSVDDTWSSREPLFEIGTAVESMPKGAFEDLHRCLHFTDD